MGQSIFTTHLTILLYTNLVSLGGSIGSKLCSFPCGAHPGREWRGGAQPWLHEGGQRNLHQAQCEL